jgi:hypothetical protein
VNPDIDDLIRDAVRRQEALAVDPGRIRAALPARTARQLRTRRMAAIGVAAAVAVAVAVPVILLREPVQGGGSGPAASSTAPTTGPAISGLATGTLRYRPTWLPEGMVERVRSIPLSAAPDPKDTTDRQWKPLTAGDGPTGHLGLTYWKFVPSPGDTALPPVATGEDGSRGDVATDQNVDINGKPGTYSTEMVTWQIDADTKLMLYGPGTGLSKEDMLRVARSVVPDTTELRAPMRVDWLPEGVSGEFLSVWGDSPTKWGSRIFADGDRAYVNTSIDTTAPTPAGEQVDVNGRTAHLAQVDEEDPIRGNYRTKWVLTMDLGDGHYLTVRGGTVPNGPTNPLTRDDMVRIALGVVPAPSPDLTWLGR